MCNSTFVTVSSPGVLKYKSKGKGGGGGAKHSFGFTMRDFGTCSFGITTLVKYWAQTVWAVKTVEHKEIRNYSRLT